MTRGRRKDLTIPPSRALIQQRDYRARKAKYLSDLEQRVRRAEEENADLRLEVNDLRRRLNQASGGPSILSNEVVDASAQLLQSLNDTASSLSRFRDVAFKDTPLSSEATPGASSAASSSTASTSYGPIRSLPSPTSSHGISPSLPQPTMPPHPAEALDTGHRSSSYSPSVPSMSYAPSSRRASTSSDLPPGSISLPSSSASSSSGHLRLDTLPHLQVHPRAPPHPREISPLVQPRTAQAPRRSLATPAHSYTLPPLRVPSPADQTFMRRAGPSTPRVPQHQSARSHPYPQPFDSFRNTSPHLTPTTWSDLPHASGSQSRSSILSRSEYGGSDSEIEEDDEDEQTAGPSTSTSFRRPAYPSHSSRADHRYDYTMHDDTLAEETPRQRHHPHSPPPLPSPSFQSSSCAGSSRQSPGDPR